MIRRITFPGTDGRPVRFWIITYWPGRIIVL